MKIFRRNDKGFTLIELLIVVAILGVLAAVVIPNVGRFVGRGQSEASQTELANIQSAVTSMMTDNKLSTLANYWTSPVNDMSTFPDATTAVTVGKLRDPNGIAYTAVDRNGYVLYWHDLTGGTAYATTPASGLVNYTVQRYTKGTYTVDANGTVTQVTTGY